jgi:putative phosphoesterase
MFSKINALTHIGILSDTHCYLHPKVFDFFSACDQLWHAGDFGNLETADALGSFKPLRGVYGNIDGQELRVHFPKDQLFTVEGKKVFMTHIGGKPGKYDAEAKKVIERVKPDILVCGHSHILRVQYDQKYKMMYINPGAAGKYGFHLKITLLRFTIDGNDLKDMEIMELSK